MSTLLLMILMLCSRGGHALIFFTLGDWGSRTPVQYAVAKALMAKASSLHPSFIVALGDNIYEDGVKTVDDKLWATTLEDVYTSAEVQVPWLACLGNHDYHHNPQAEIDYAVAQGKDGRWVMDDYYYSRTVALEDGGTLQLVFIDTVSLAMQTHIKGVEAQRRVGLVSQDIRDRTVALLPELKARRSSQLSWLEKTLNESTADWLLVAGHFPLRSGGEHGDTDELIPDLLPLLQTYQVDAYLSGHDHTLQVLEEDDLMMFVSGGGGKDTGTYRPTKFNLWGTTEPGFMVHTVDSGVMTVQTISQSGRVLYTSTMQQRRNQGGALASPAGAVSVELQA